MFWAWIWLANMPIVIRRRPKGVVTLPLSISLHLFKGKRNSLTENGAKTLDCDS
jgi:hypothetical protein